MKPYIFIVSIISVFTLLALQGCEKAKPGTSTQTEIDTFKFGSENFEYVDIPVGRYFIYRDSATNAMDSIIVTKNVREYQYVPEQPAPDILHDGWPAFYEEIFTLNLTRYIANVGRIWLEGQAVAGSISNPAPMAIYMPYARSMFIYTLGSDLSGDTVTVEGITYPHVFKSVDDRLNTEGYRLTYYWAKSIGIIKSEEILPNEPIKTYTLVRHN